jgi:hypothetical protein
VSFLSPWNVGIYFCFVSNLMLLKI